MSTVKPGYGYGDYGYVQRKPLINYHSQKAPASVSTVVTDISGMSVNEKPPYDGAGGTVQKKLAFLLEEDHAGGYSGHHGGTMQRAYQHGSEVGGYAAPALHHDGAVQKVYAHGGEVRGLAFHDGAKTGGVQAQTAPYGKTYKHHIPGAGSHQGGIGALAHQHKQEQSSEDESDSEEEELAYGYGQLGTGGAQHYGGYKQEEKHDSVVQKHYGYGEHQHGGDAGGYAALRLDSTIREHGYGGQKAYQHGGDAGGYGYGAFSHDSSVENNGYGGQQADQDGG